MSEPQDEASQRLSAEPVVFLHDKLVRLENLLASISQRLGPRKPSVRLFVTVMR